MNFSPKHMTRRKQNIDEDNFMKDDSFMEKEYQAFVDIVAALKKQDAASN